MLQRFIVMMNGYDEDFDLISTPMNDTQPMPTCLLFSLDAFFSWTQTKMINYITLSEVFSALSFLVPNNFKKESYLFSGNNSMRSCAKFLKGEISISTHVHYFGILFKELVLRN